MIKKIKEYLHTKYIKENSVFDVSEELFVEILWSFNTRPYNLEVIEKVNETIILDNKTRIGIVF